MPTIRSSVDVAVPAPEVWAIVSDLATWTAWNPVISRIEGRLVRRQRIRARFDLGPGWPPVWLSARIVAIDEGASFSWRGGTRGLLSGEHHFEVHPRGPNACRFEQWERFSGVAAAALNGALCARIARAFADMDEALVNWAERRVTSIVLVPTGARDNAPNASAPPGHAR